MGKTVDIGAIEADVAQGPLIQGLKGGDGLHPPAFPLSPNSGSLDRRTHPLDRCQRGARDIALSFGN
jgi:hypothetical protein